MSHASSRLGYITSPLLYQLFKGGRACAAASCCLHHHNAAAAAASTMPVAEAATTAKAAPVQPSRELAHVRYFIDESVDAGVQDKLIDLLNAYGAAPCKLLPASEGSQETTTTGPDGHSAASPIGHVDLEDVTHIITMTMQHYQHKAVESRNNQVIRAAEESGKQISTAPNATGRRGDLIAVVTPLWVTKTCDHRKRQEEQFFSPDPAKIFSGVTICTEGLLPGDSEVVKGIVSALGGQWRGPLVAEVTHLICMNLEGKKSQRLLGSGLRLGMRAVLPHWVDDCVKLHLRVPEDPYLFPNPPCFDAVVRSPIPYKERLQEFFKSIGKQAPTVNNYSSSILDPHVLDGDSQFSTREKTVSPAMNSSDPSKQVLSGHAVYIATSCELGPERLSTILNKIKEYGGEALAAGNIQENAVLLDRADIVIVGYREGWEFWKAYDSGKTLGNIDWLIHVLFDDLSNGGAILPSPTKRLLHWPWPRDAADGFKDTNFTVSGYVGQARETIKRMIELLGGTFEGTLTKNKTTHLIASVQSGSKVTHAKPWGIPIINHLWIEDSFRHWSAADVADAKYLNFESSVIEEDLPKFAAGRAIDLEDVKKWAQEPKVQNEKNASLQNLDDAIVDEMDEAQEEELLLSSPAPSERDTSPAEMDVTLQEQAQYSRALDMDPESSPLPSIKDAIAATQFHHPPSPSASDDPSETSANAAGIKGKPKKMSAKATQSAATSTPNVRHPSRAVEPPSSVSDYEEVKQEPADKKRKRELAGLGELDSGYNNNSYGYTGRKAAQAATQKLRDTIMPDVMLYEKEKRGGGKAQLDEMFGGKAPSSAAKKTPSTHARNGSNGGRGGTQSTSDSDLDASAPPSHVKAAKRARVQSPATPHVSTVSKAIKGRGSAKQPPARAASPEHEYMSDRKPAKKLLVSKVVSQGRKPHIASTGAAISDVQRKALMKLGCKMLGDNIEGCTHLVVKGISRTVKFLSAIPMGAYFVTEQWVHDSVAAGQLLDEDKYILKDKAGETKHSMSLARSLSLARRSKLFDDHTFYITPNVLPSFEALKAISEAAGAKVIKRLPTVKQVLDRADVYIISSVAERPTWEHLVKQDIPVYSGEAVIKAVMQQQKEFEQYTIDEVEGE